MPHRRSVKKTFQSVSPAERRVLDELVEGKSNKEIARTLGRSLGTVKNQLLSAYRKLGVRSRVQVLLLLR